MKILALLILFPTLALAASQDFVKGIDFTGRSNVTQSALNQLVDAGYPATNRGMLIITNGAPSAINDPKLVRYIWLDTSLNPPVMKVYDTNTATWVASQITPGSIGTLQLANGAVTTIKIADLAVDNSKLAADSVTSDKIVNGTILSNDIASSAINASLIYPATINYRLISSNGIVASNITERSIFNYHLANGFLIYNTNLAAGAVNNTNIQEHAVYGTNIAAGTIDGTNIMAGTIGTNLLTTNVTQYLPKIFATITGTNGTVVRGAGLTSTRTSMGQYTLVFDSALSFTNYTVLGSTMDSGGAANDYGFSVSTNKTTGFSVNVWARGSGASVDPLLLYITVLF